MACSRKLLAYDKDYFLQYMISKQQRMVCSSAIKDYLAAIYEKHTTTFQTVITKIQTFSIYGINIVVAFCKLLSHICYSIKVDILIVLEQFKVRLLRHFIKTIQP